MPQQTFKPGDRTYFGSDSLTHPHSASFEDDGETGYFYALDLTRSDNMIVDAVQIYSVANVSDRERACAIDQRLPPRSLRFRCKARLFSHQLPKPAEDSIGLRDSSDHHRSDEAIVWSR